VYLLPYLQHAKAPWPLQHEHSQDEFETLQMQLLSLHEATYSKANRQHMQTYLLKDIVNDVFQFLIVKHPLLDRQTLSI
jgi:hypothetical protein